VSKWKSRAVFERERENGREFTDILGWLANLRIYPTTYLQITKANYWVSTK